MKKSRSRCSRTHRYAFSLRNREKQRRLEKKLMEYRQKTSAIGQQYDKVRKAIASGKKRVEVLQDDHKFLERVMKEVKLENVSLKNALSRKQAYAQEALFGTPGFGDSVEEAPLQGPVQGEIDHSNRHLPLFGT